VIVDQPQIAPGSKLFPVEGTEEEEQMQHRDKISLIRIKAFVGSVCRTETISNQSLQPVAATA